MDIAARLRMVLHTLDGVTVSGRENWDRLLGSMQEIEKIVTVLEHPAPPAAKEDADG